MKLQVTNYKLQVTRKGFTLIELLVAIFIFSLVTVGIVSVFVSTVTSYGKAKAIKTVKENAEFAMSSIAKDVRMGKIENATISDGTRDDSLEVKRNRGGLACYKFLDNNKLGLCEKICSSCGDSDWKNIIDLSDTNMEFDINTTTPSNSKAGFYSCPSTFGNPTECPDNPLADTSAERRGWVEINLNIQMAADQEMSADQINVQTIVSSRDYGWEEVN